MATCTKCGATLVARARFCAACGTPVASASVAPPPPEAKPGDPRPPTDPFAKTVLKDDPEPALQNLPPPAAAVSPMAASVMANTAPRPTPLPAQPAPPAPQQPMRPTPRPPSNPAPQPPPAHSFSPGALVLVYWADGNRYPGTVLQVSQYHVFVVFPNGTQQWIDARYVTTGG